MAKLSFDQYVDLRLLLNIEGVGPAKVRNLLSHFKNFNTIFSATLKDLIQVYGINTNLAKRILNSHANRNDIKYRIEYEIDQNQKLGINLITIWDDEYPEQLKNIYDPPLILYYKGKLEENDKYAVAVVGTRQPSDYGKIQAEKFTNWDYFIRIMNINWNNFCRSSS